VKTESVAIKTLVLDPANARKHAAKNLEAIKGSLARFGQQKPIVVGKGNVVIAGNGTLEAARSLGWDKIDVVRTELVGPEATAFAITDNRTGELAEWDAGVLSETLKALKDIDFDLGAIGFDADDLAKLIATPEGGTAGLTDPDEVPENVETRCKPGDLWTLGKHRLLCGDSTNVQHVERLMGGEKADMVFTDPPYGMKLDTDLSAVKRPRVKGWQNKPKDYDRVIGDHEDFHPDLINTVFACFEYCREIFLWGADYYADLLPGRNDGSWVVWDKRTETTDSMMGSMFELCWSRQRHRREIARVRWIGFHGIESEDTKRRVHPTQKPAALAEFFFEKWGKKDDLVADLYLGSGSTLIACEKTGRRCFGMELDPKYCDVILARWEKFTGKTASLSAGKSEGT
jgi:DNA modification methylase